MSWLANEFSSDNSRCGVSWRWRIVWLNGEFMRSHGIHESDDIVDMFSAET
jgi:hypothetical protein